MPIWMICRQGRGELMSDKKLSTEIKQVAEGIDKFTNRIILEDLNGHKFQIVKVRVLGTNTDDPGIVLRLELT